MDVKSAFLYGTIDEEVGTIDQTLFIIRQRGDFILVQVYVDDIIFGSSNPQLCREFEALMHEKFQMSAMGDILKKFRYSDVRSSNTPMDKENPWGKHRTRKDVDLHLYRSMIGSSMYLTASRPDIMFAVCACARHQVTPKECHLHAVKRIFRYLKGHPKLGLWYPKESPFDLTIVATSTTEAEYVAAASCCGQVLWIQNQLLDYGLSMPCEALSREFSTSILRFNTIMARLQFCDFHNMVAILKKGEHNIEFHPMVNFIEASPLRIVPLFDTMLVQQGEGSGTPTEPHHTPSPEAQSPSHTTHTSPTLPPVTTTSLPTVTQSDTPIIRQYTRRTKIAQSSILPTVADEPASPLRDVSQGEAFPTDSSFIADQDRATIDKSSTLPHDSAPWVTSPVADEGKINRLKERVKILEDREGVAATRSGDDAPIKGRSMDEGEAATERISD
nr:hypothetical protein [Tanacetum cinerariifolium]